MRTDPPAIQSDGRDGSPLRTRLNELLNTLVVMRRAHHACDYAADDPEIVTRHMNKLADELDGVIAAVKAVVETSGLPPSTRSVPYGAASLRANRRDPLERRRSDDLARPATWARRRG